MRRLRPLALLALPVAAGCLDRPDAAGIAAEPVPSPVIAAEVLAELPACAGSVLGALTADAVEPPGAGSGAWLAPEEDTLTAVRGSWKALHAADPELAVGMVRVVGYEVCRGEGTEDDLVLWRPSWAGTGRALVALRVRDARGLILEAPYAFADAEGASEAARAFEELEARVLVLAGTHPCASAAPSPCGGASACGPAGSAADPTGNDRTVFHVGHTLAAETYGGDWVVSLRPLDGDGASVSAGTLEPVEDGSAAAALGTGLMIGMPEVAVTSCNEFPGAVWADRECGVDSVQARHLNGAEDACGGAPTRTSERYAQIALSEEARRDGDGVIDGLAWALGVLGR